MGEECIQSSAARSSSCCSCYSTFSWWDGGTCMWGQRWVGGGLIGSCTMGSCASDIPLETKYNLTCLGKLYLFTFSQVYSAELLCCCPPSRCTGLFDRCERQKKQSCKSDASQSVQGDKCVPVWMKFCGKAIVVILRIFSLNTRAKLSGQVVSLP